MLFRGNLEVFPSAELCGVPTLFPITGCCPSLGMFATNLRKRSFWQALAPIVTTHQYRKLSGRCIMSLRISLTQPEVETDGFDLAVGDDADQSTYILLIDSCHLHDQYQRLDEWLDRNTQAYRVVMLVSLARAQYAPEALQELQLQYAINSPPYCERHSDGKKHNRQG